MTTDLIKKITEMPVGKQTSTQWAGRAYASCARTPAGYRVECGWIVPEAHDDDPDAGSYQPIKGAGAAAAWVGHRWTETTVDAAVARYQAAIAAAGSPGSAVSDGSERIGSVWRRR